MKLQVFSIGAMVLLVGTVVGQPVVGDQPENATAVRASFRKLPLGFVENRGQWDARARFVARKPGIVAWLETDAITLDLHRQTSTEEIEGLVVRLTFDRSSDRVRLRGERPDPGVHNFFLGADPSKWRTEVPGFSRVLYHNLYSGVNLRVRQQNDNLEYDVILEPGADLDQVVIRCEGIQGLGVDADGSLTMRTIWGPLRQKPPRTWYATASGERRPVQCRYRVLSRNRFGFAVQESDPHRTLVIDPGLEWCTLMGGSGWDETKSVAVDPAGVVTAAGYVYSSDFPTTAGAYDRTHNGSCDGFVARLNANASSLIYATYLGGAGSEAAFSVAILPSGDAIVAGDTSSANFPTTPGSFDRTYNGGTDAFVSRLDARGAVLVFSTYLGGANLERNQREDLAIDKNGNVVITGETSSSDFPTTPGAFDTTYNGGADAFVTRLKADGSSLQTSTYLGGTSSDYVQSVTVDPSGSVTVAGYTDSSDFPTTSGAYDQTYNGNKDAFVARFNPNLSSLVYSTFLGGSNTEFSHNVGVVVDASGSATMAGSTRSTDFPTTMGAYDRTHNGSEDVFVTRLTPSGGALVYSTFIGGSSSDHTQSLTTGGSGVVTVTGESTSSDFPTTPGAFDTTQNGHLDAFVTQVSAAGDTLYYSTFVGDTGWDASQDIAYHESGSVVVGGYTKSSGFPTTPGVFQRTYKGGSSDPFVLRIDMLPTGVSRYGRSTPACSGPMAMSVTRLPKAGGAGFAFTCNNAPPGTTGVLAVGLGQNKSGLPIAGIILHIRPELPFFALPVSSDAIGGTVTYVPIPNGVKGIRFYGQYFWTNTPSCPGPGPISASNALEVIIQ
jgi:hypothetical protein